MNGQGGTFNGPVVVDNTNPTAADQDVVDEVQDYLDQERDR